MLIKRGIGNRFAACVSIAWTMAASGIFSEKVAKAREPWNTSRIHGSPNPPEPYRIVSAFPNLKFQLPTSVEEIPNQNRLLVTERGGKVLSFVKDANAKSADLVIDLTANLPQAVAGQTVSLFDAELDPKFSENHYVYVCYVYPGQSSHTRVSRFTLSDELSPKAVPESEVVILTWPSGGHNAGCLEFGRDSMLYISTGDGTGPNPPDGRTTGQDVSDLLGAVLRIDVDAPSGERAYSIPADNPFADGKLGRPEIWAYGLRNPWKFGVDRQNGKIFAADNGWETWELVHEIVSGGNCGWPVMEGRAALRTEVKIGPTPIRPPVKDHPHSEANSVIGGPVYRGEKLPQLNGSFIYGDYITGTIWALSADRDNSYTHSTLVDTDQRIVAFTEGSCGEIFVLDYDFTGQIYELLPSGLADTSAKFPKRLSETGLFESLESMKPAQGVMPYSVVASRWMDGAKADRFLAIPGTGKVSMADAIGRPATYPEGMVLAKHVTLPQIDGQAPIRLETQILHYESGSWRPYSYLWDQSGQDATLAESIGASKQVSGADKVERTWHVNAVNECKLCHNAESGNVLGFVANQLAAGSLAQLSEQSAIAPPTAPVYNATTIVDPHDATADLDSRARSYLHVNCGMCHQPGGNAIVSFFLRRDLPFEKLNTNKGTGIGTFGMTNAKLIVPSDPYRSVLMYRMSKLGYARMPYIGSRMVDSDGVMLIDRWIRSLLKGSSEKPSPPLIENSPEERALKALTNKSSNSTAEQRRAIELLTKSTEGSLALGTLLHQRALDDELARFAIQLGSSARSDIRGLFETFVPEGQRRPTLGPNADPQLILNRQGDRDRGKLIYFSDNARCRSCHEIDDKSKSVGPTLMEIAKKYPKPNELVDHVLKPSLKIDEPYVAYTILTADGRVLNGLILERTDAELALQTPDKQIVRVKSTDIEQLKKSEKSLMPDAILSDLTPQEAADLFEFIRDGDFSRR